MGHEQGRLRFEYELTDDEGSVTSYGGLPVVLDYMRSLGATASIGRNVQIAARSRKHDEPWVVEALVMLLAAGGDCLDDIEVLRSDRALQRLLERELPSAETLRKFLYSFHDETLMAAAQQAAAAKGEKAFVPEESAPLAGLAQVLTDFVAGVAARGHGKRATLDIDATIQESHKREATEHYQGGRGYQPVTAYWAEQDLVVADEFRDGNVPAGKETLRLVKRAFAALPSSIEDRRLRSDSAMYNAETIRWLIEERIAFSISADMGKHLREVCVAVDESKWELVETRANEQVHVCEVSFFPGNWPKSMVSPTSSSARAKSSACLLRPIP